MTGFEPFGRWQVNSSWEAVSGLSATRHLQIHRLPVDHQLAASKIRALISELLPNRVLLVGLADRPVPTLELQARLGPNLMEAATPTRTGRWYFAAAQRAIQAIGTPCRLSTDAGRYVCETTYWAALGTQTPEVAFLHLPPLHGTWTQARLTRIVRQTLAEGRARVGGPTGR